MIATNKAIILSCRGREVNGIRNCKMGVDSSVYLDLISSKFQSVLVSSPHINVIAPNFHTFQTNFSDKILGKSMMNI